MLESHWCLWKGNIDRLVAPNEPYSLFAGFIHLAAGLACGFTGLAAGYAIGIVGDAVSCDCHL